MNWIKCSDKLPEPDEHVLVYGEDGIFTAYRDDNEKYPTWNCYPVGSYASDGLVYCITHWMSLPKLPIN